MVWEHFLACSLQQDANTMAGGSIPNNSLDKLGAQATKARAPQLQLHISIHLPRFDNHIPRDATDIHKQQHRAVARVG